jgi:hypothetical protein
MTPASARRGRDGRFVPAGDIRTRYSQISEVLRATDAEHPERVSTRRFDESRESTGHPSLPRARDLADWLGMPWGEVKAVALDETRDQVKTLKSRRRETARPWSDVDGAVLALRRVAAALEQDHLSATSYDEYRRRSSSATRSVLPTSAQIVKLIGSWSGALELAGLAQSRPTGAGLPVVDALGVFVSTQGRLPGRGELQAFAADPRWAFPLQRLGARKWKEWLAAFEMRWVGEMGRWMPPPSNPAAAFLPLQPSDISSLPQRAQGPRGYWNRARVIASVVAYLEENPGVTSLQQKPYRQWANRRNARGVKTALPSTLTRHGTLGDLEREARQTMNKT